MPVHPGGQRDRCARPSRSSDLAAPVARNRVGYRRRSALPPVAARLVELDPLLAHLAGHGLAVGDLLLVEPDPLDRYRLGAYGGTLGAQRHLVLLLADRRP